MWRSLVHGPPSPDDVARSMANVRVYCALFGIPPTESWGSPADLRRWMDDRIDEGAVGLSPGVVALGHRLLEAPRPALRPLYRLVRAATIGLLPPPVARLFGWEPAPRHQAAVRAAVHATRVANRLLPAGLRQAQAYHQAQVRVGSRGSLPWGSGLVENAIAGGLRGHGSDPPRAH